MTNPDLNLLFTLDAVLAEGSVAGAARRLGLSPSAMSRSLARLRQVTGDPLLVRAGRGMVPTPRAIELSESVPPLVSQSIAALQPASAPDLRSVERPFTIRTSEGFVETFGAAMIGCAAAEAPGVTLRFVLRAEKESDLLRDATVDLEIGVVGRTVRPEVRAQLLFRDRLTGVAAKGHELCTAEITAKRYAACRHILVSRRGADRGPVDDALASLGLERRISAIVGGFSTAVALAGATELVATVPERLTTALRGGLYSFELPFDTPAIPISLLWHPRLDADPVHRWLRSVVRQICTAAGGQRDDN
ncbi:MAG: LysR family transcriptional regulator [Pyrinomonadaceae bacterium]|nr:LysR family transcriptional regulator [Pyrinomonadaceae bacterium]